MRVENAHRIGQLASLLEGKPGQIQFRGATYGFGVLEIVQWNVYRPSIPSVCRQRVLSGLERPVLLFLFRNHHPPEIQSRFHHPAGTAIFSAGLMIFTAGA